jgi:hypothetical protein
VQAYRERAFFMLLPSRNEYPSGRQKDWYKRERSEAVVNGSGSAVPWRDIVVQTAEPPDLQKKKASQLQSKTETDRLIATTGKEKNARDKKSENLDIDQNAAVQRRGYGRIHRAGVHREVADLRGWACTA